MIIAYGGSDDVAISEDLRKRLRGLLASLRPDGVVGGLSSDVDLLFARTALAERLPVHALFPPGAGGAEDIERLRRNPRVTEIERDGHTGDDVARILDEAQSLAASDGVVWVITVRSGASPGDLVEQAEELGLLTLAVWPASRTQEAFVLMPFGRKRDLESGNEVDCDQPFHKIYRPLLEDAGLTWSRSDLETDTGIIHPGMLEQLANCDVALADLTTANFNVAYELGVRHVFAPRSTILVSPQVTEIGPRRPPFDVAMSRVHHFTRGLTLTDQQAEAAIRALQPVLRDAIADAGPDSPAYKWFQMISLPRPLLLNEEVREHEERLTAARRRVVDAVAGSDPDVMRAEAERLAADSDLTPAVRRALRIELAWALLGEAAYREARDLFDLCEPPRGDALRRTWLQRATMAHRRLGEEADKAGDPSRGLEHFRRARELIEAAVGEGYGDSETYGIWGGLIKREIVAAGPPLTDPATELLFDDMTRKYRAGFEADPDHYPGVNLVMALRLGPRDERFDAEFREVTAATRWFARRAINTGRWDAVWARFSLAELELHEALEDGTDPAEAVKLYEWAARHARADQLESVRFQLRFLLTFGQRAEVLTPLLDRLS